MATTYHRHRGEAQAGFVRHAVVRRDAWQSHETTPRVFLLAHRAAGPLQEAGSTPRH